MSFGPTNTLLLALGLPRMAALGHLRLSEYGLLASQDSAAVAAYFGDVAAAEHRRMRAMQPWTRVLAMRLLRMKIHGYNVVRGTPHARLILQALIRERWGVPYSLDELASAGCPWLWLPDFGLIDIMTVFHACNDAGFRRRLMPRRHPMLCAMEAYFIDTNPRTATEIDTVTANRLYNPEEL
jgi:hypothetical protein